MKTLARWTASASMALASIILLLVGATLGCGHDENKPEAVTSGSIDSVSDSEVDRIPATSTDSPSTLDLLNGRTPAPGLLTGGQPTPEVLAKAASQGYRTIIDLRTPGEDRGYDEAAEVERLGMTYVTLAIGGAEALTAANAEALSAALNTEEAPILLHCGSGNRVGALLALKAFHVDGSDADTALEFGRAAGMTSLAGTIEAQLKADPD